MPLREPGMQSGRNRHLIQSNSSYYPLIIHSGTIVTHPDNGLPAIQFVAANKQYLANPYVSTDFDAIPDFSVNAVMYQNPSITNPQFLCGIDKIWKLDYF